MNKWRKYGNVIKTINVCTRPNKGRNCEREKMLEERMRLNDTFFMFYWQDSSASQSHCHSSSTTTGKHDDFMHFGCDGGWSCLYISKMPEITKYCKVILAFPPRKTVPMLKFLLYSTLKIVVFASKCYSKMHNIFNINRTMMYRFWMWVSVWGQTTKYSSDMNLHQQCSGGIPSKKSLLWKIYPVLLTDLKSVKMMHEIRC